MLRKIISPIVFIFLFMNSGIAIGTCTYESSSALVPVIVPCSNCSGGYTGRYGYLDYGTYSYCIDTQVGNIASFATNYCTTGACGNMCGGAGPTVSCGYVVQSNNKCSSNVYKNVINYCPSGTFYKCTAGYKFTQTGCEDPSTANSSCSCAKICTMSEYFNTSSNTCVACPVAGNNPSGTSLSGQTRPSSAEPELASVGITSCYFPPDTSLVDSSGTFQFNNNCNYTE